MAVQFVVQGSEPHVMKIFLSAGEPSGDLHAANLIRSLRKYFPNAEFEGFGGDKMAQAGARLHYKLANLAVMWFLSVLLNAFTFIWLIFKADRHFRDERPDAVVLVDYPGFNWWIARCAKGRGIPVFYFVPPQIWAWAGWRVSKVRRFVDQVLCSLPFEPAWYHARGVSQAIYIGHPYFDELAERSLETKFLAEQRARSGDLVVLLPGSRNLEILRNLPDMVAAARKLAHKRSGVRFAIACLHERHQTMAQEIITDSIRREGPIPGAGIDVHAGRTAELIRLGQVAWAVSGSVSLELMYEALPTVVVYKVKRVDLWIARPFIKTRYISLVNLLADHEVFPEYLTSADVSLQMTDWARKWLDDPAARARAVESLAELRNKVARPGASDRAAEQIARWLSGAATGSHLNRQRQPGTIGSPAGSVSSARCSSFIRR
jgi:lipid-A-disaccharide synthase